MLNFWVLAVAKVIYGVATGIAIVAVSKYFSETIPVIRTGRYGFAINLGIVLGVTFMLCMGLIKPKDDESLSTKKSAMMIINFVPVAVASIVLLLWAFVYR